MGCKINYLLLFSHSLVIITFIISRVRFSRCFIFIIIYVWAYKYNACDNIIIRLYFEVYRSDKLIITLNIPVCIFLALLKYTSYTLLIIFYIYIIIFFGKVFNEYYTFRSITIRYFFFFL